jgi:RND family efflux transporter MFP subunit
VEYNEKALSAVTLKFGGWVEELMVKAVGDSVRKGDPLFAIYSPELLEAQRNYLLARESSPRPGDKAASASQTLAEEALRGARERLLLWDFTESQIKEIEAKGEPVVRPVIHSKVNGIVTARNIVLGAYVEPGKNLYEVADLSTVWVNADIYEYEIPLVKVGRQAAIQLSSMPGKELAGKVAYLYPYVDPPTRTVRVRMEVPNADGKLRPGMYATVLLESSLGDQLVVDEDAVLFTGTRSMVFVDKGDGVLEPRNVTVGERADGLAVVLAGLFEGEKIVTSGNFLVDSESRLKAALKQGAAPAAGEHEGHTGKSGQETMPAMPNMPGM